MAEKKQAQDLELGEAAKAGNRKKMLIIIIAAVVLLIGGGVGGWLLLKNHKKPVKTEAACEEGDSSCAESAATDEPVAEEEAPDDGKPHGPFYQELGEAIVANIPSDKRPRTLKLNVVFVVKNEMTAVKVREQMPMLRSELLNLLATTKVEDIMSIEGQNAFREKALSTVRDAMQRELKKPTIDKILFTSFVMQ